MDWAQFALIVASFAGAGVLLYFMEYAPKSVAALKKDNPDFRMPDMTFRGSADGLYRQLDAVGEDGRRRMRRYWLLDFGFIVCFWCVMFAVARNLVAQTSWLFTAMMIAATARAALDVLENTLLLSVLRAYPTRRDGMAGFAAKVTAVKLALIVIWVALLFVQLFLRAFGIGK